MLGVFVMTRLWVRRTVYLIPALLIYILSSFAVIILLAAQLPHFANRTYNWAFGTLDRMMWFLRRHEILCVCPTCADGHPDGGCYAWWLHHSRWRVKYVDV